jgi:hypothetical protein
MPPHDDYLWQEAYAELHYAEAQLRAILESLAILSQFWLWSAVVVTGVVFVLVGTMMFHEARDAKSTSASEAQPATPPRQRAPAPSRDLGPRRAATREHVLQNSHPLFP